MLVINYLGNKPQQDRFKFAVNGDNNSQTIKFVLKKQQGDIDLSSPSFTIYFLCQSQDKSFVDKAEIESFVVEGNDIILEYKLLGKHTQFKMIDVGVSFENTNQEVVYKTANATISIQNGIMADDKIANTYPTIIAQMQAEIDELKNQKGGGASEVLIDRVYLTYDDKKSIRSDYLGLDYDDDGETKHFVNDSSRIWVNFITTPINGKMEDEIKNGRFIIRLDYPLKNRSQSSKFYSDSSDFIYQHTSIKKYGVGTRGFAPNFIGDETEMNATKKEILLNSLIFVNESDIKVNSYGEKYIHKKVSLFDYINNICSLTDVETKEKITLAPITMEWVNNNEDGRDFFVGYLLETWSNGIPHTFDNGEDILQDERFNLFAGTKRMKMFKGLNGFPDINQFGKTNSVKLNPAFACYSVVKTSDYYDDVGLYSPYYVGSCSTKNFNFKAINDDFVISNGGNPASKKRTKKAYMSARPRCCILNDDYETNEKAFIKKYPQADQQIRLYCKCMKDIADYGVGIAPIFRMLITQK